MAPAHALASVAERRGFAVSRLLTMSDLAKAAADRRCAVLLAFADFAAMPGGGVLAAVVARALAPRVRLLIYWRRPDLTVRRLVGHLGLDAMLMTEGDLPAWLEDVLPLVGRLVRLERLVNHRTSQLPGAIRGDDRATETFSDFRAAVTRFEECLIRDALACSNGKRCAARRLNLRESSLRTKMKKLGLGT